MKHVEIFYERYDNYIKMLEEKQCYVIEKGMKQCKQNYKNFVYIIKNYEVKNGAGL